MAKVLSHTLMIFLALAILATAARSTSLSSGFVGVSSQAAGHKTLVPQLIAALAEAGAGDVVVVCGGVIPPQDYPELEAAGVAAVFGPGSNIVEAARRILGIVRERSGR